MLNIGAKAPAFTLPDQNGEMRSLSDYAGKKVILYFYSKDMTSGCTKQACGFADLYPQFMEQGAVILGVSKDSVESHTTYLIDEAGMIVKAFGNVKAAENPAQMLEALDA